MVTVQELLTIDQEGRKIGMREERTRLRADLLAKISLLFSFNSTITEDDLRAIVDRVAPEGK